MLEIYLPTIILYFILALVIGFLLGMGTLTQDIPKGGTFNILYIFKTIKVSALFESVFNIFSKLLKMITGIDINPTPLKK